MLKAFQLFLILQDFVKTQSLITVHLILSGDVNPSPAKVTQHGTWEMKCGLVKKLVMMCSLKLFFLKTKNDRGPCFTGCQRKKSRCPVLIHWW